MSVFTRRSDFMNAPAMLPPADIRPPTVCQMLGVLVVVPLPVVVPPQLLPPAIPEYFIRLSHVLSDLPMELSRFAWFAACSPAPPCCARENSLPRVSTDVSAPAIPAGAVLARSKPPDRRW